MPEPKMLTERELLSLLTQEQQAADSFINGTAVATQRAKNLRYYQDGTLGNEIEGRSQVKDRSVFETVEWIMPQLIEMFLAGDSVVKFEPQNANDIEGSEQATDYVNYVMTRRNNGFLIFHDWFKDALLEKNSTVKVYWDEDHIPRKEEYRGIDEDQLAALLEPDNVELIELEDIGVMALEDGKGGLREAKIFNAKIAVTTLDGKVTIEVIPSDKFLVRAGTVDLSQAEYCAEIFTATKTDLLASGFDPEVVEQVSFTDNDPYVGNQTRLARGYFDQTSHSPMANFSNAHQSMRKALVTEAYIRMDYDGDGITELRQIFHTDNTILSNREVDEIPYIDLCSIRLPHKYIGMSIGDVVRDLQEMKTMIMRGIMDHMYATINGRYEAVEGAVNMADLFDPVPGGAVRVTAPGMVKRLDTPDLDPQTFSLLQYIDQIREDRAGVNRVQQGVDKHALGSNVASGAMDTAMRAAQQRIQMLGRLFAETGVKELFYRIYSLVRKHQNQDDIVRLRDTFVPVQPYDWMDRKDMIVTVGTGNTSPQQRLAELSLIRDTMMMAGQSGANVVLPKNIYNFSVELAKSMGRQDAAKFFSEPPDQPPPPQPDIDQQIKQEQNQIKKAELALKEREQQLEEAKFEWSKLVDMAEIELEDKQERAVGLQQGK